MKNMFSQYDRGRDVNYREIWKNALFVFDTNVLLNLYRYQASTRDQLLNVLDKFSERIWIPHHVALEFHRNRVKVIVDQNKRFADLRASVAKAQDTLQKDLIEAQFERRHSLIDPSPFFKDFSDLSTKFIAQLDEVQKGQQMPMDPDPLKEKIGKLFEGRVGPEPKSQAAVDGIYKVAEARFNKEIPPGYMDAVKEKGSTDEYLCEGIIYKKRFGDYILWDQMLAHTKEKGIKQLIFVTDDAKEDWWWKVHMDGPKSLGPRPELIDEAQRVGGVESFLMYRPEGFLSYSGEFLEARVSDETLEEVRDVSRIGSGRSSYNKMIKLSSRAMSAVQLWLTQRFTTVQRNEKGFPDLVAEIQGRTFGFDVQLLLRQSKNILVRLHETAYRAHFEVSTGSFEMITVVLVCDDLAEAKDTELRVRREKFASFSSRIRVLIGVMTEGEGEEATFVPICDLPINNAEGKDRFFPGFEGLGA